MIFLKAFIIGGLICVIGQILIDKTQLTPARILVSYVTAGAILQVFGLYQKLIDFAGAGASAPLSGFGCLLVKGAKKAVEENGFLGIFTGGLASGAAGITAALLFGFIASVIFKPKAKS